MERAAELTRDPGRRGSLLIAAADARADAGSYAQVAQLLTAAELGPLGPLQQAQVERLRAQVAFAQEFGAAAVPPLLAAARRLERLDPVAARDTFLTAIGAAIIAGRFGSDSLHEAAAAARNAVPVGDAFPDQLLAGLVSWVLEGRASAVPLLNRALEAMRSTDLSHFWLAAAVVEEMYRPELLCRMSKLAVRRVREIGALSLLPNVLALRANCLLAAGRFADTAQLLDQIDEVTRATGASVYQWSRLALAAYRGPEQPVQEFLAQRLTEAAALGNGRLHAAASLALAILHNGLGNHQAALEAANEVLAWREIAFSPWSLSELIEAAVRAGQSTMAADARTRLAEVVAATPTRAAQGVQALADALAGPHEQAEERYRAAVELLGVAETAVQGNRARLLFGEWLHTTDRRAEARMELRAAYETFSTMGATVFADRAARELAVTGESVKKLPVSAQSELTPRETAIARLAASGRTNPQIAEALFLSPRTVEWHLRKVFARLGITSRRDLATALRQW